jgi:hypothetical protein
MNKEYANNDHYKWIEEMCKTKCSPLGMQVANILGYCCNGIYNTPILYEKTDWTSHRYIKVIWKGQVDLATWDAPKLVLLFVECNRRLVRMSISPHSFGCLKMEFWQRATNDRKESDGCGSNYMPTLEEIIAGRDKDWEDKDENETRR